MNIVKKIVSIILCLSFLMASVSITSFASIYEECMQESNGIVSKMLDCANDEAIAQVKNGQSYVKMSNIGLTGEYTLHVFDYSKLNEVISKLNPESQAISLKEIDKIGTWESNIVPIMSGVFATAIASLGVFFYNKKAEQGIQKQLSGLVTTGIEGAELIAYLHNKKTELEKQNLLSPLGIFGIISSTGLIVMSSVKVCIDSFFSNKKYEQTHLRRIDGFNYQSTLEQISTCINKGSWQDGRDTIFVEMCSDPQDYYSLVSFIKSGKNYTDAEKEQHEKDMITLGENISQILNKSNN
ncbi:MAG: hypothetical protein RUMPE_00766 [Eubacteriales bacterium SKADARSKE-1]|nr:hypothetical protein [Eubacteriales bacterium SKADARSKE-1]